MRIFLCPVYLALMVVDFRYHCLWACAVFGIASITDFLDGKIARKKNLVTTFGKLVDPVADKMLTTAALLAFMRMGICNIWIVMVILTREFLITSFRLVATAQGVVIPAGILGKIKTAAQMIFSVIIMLALDFYEFVMSFETFALISNVLLGITAFLAAISGIKYVVDARKVVDISM